MRWFSKRRPHDSPATPTGQATLEDVRYAYRLFLKREPDEEGLRHYTARVRAGMPLDELIRCFVNSNEYCGQIEQECPGNRAVVDLGDYRVMVDRQDPDFGAHIYDWKEYEEHVRAAVRTSVHPGDVCVDVGANVGVITFLAAALTGPTGRVIAVEPNPGNVQFLYRGIALNGFTNVEVLPLAVSERRAVMSLTGLSNTHLIEARAVGEGGYFVQTERLDDVLGDMPRLDFVKMDIEGHEPPALRGFMRNLTRHRPTLLVEFNPRCLAIQREPLDAFVAGILSLYPVLRVTSAFGDDTTFARAGDLLDYWQRRDAEIAAAGRLPKGYLHFDLVASRPAGDELGTEVRLPGASAAPLRADS